MRRIVTMVIDDRKQEDRTVEAFSKDSANMHITAPTMQDAIRLFENAEQDMQDACDNWQYSEPEEPEETEPSKHYVVYHVSIEEMDEDAAEYEDSVKGQRFLKRLERAWNFYFKHSKSSLKATELAYLANKHHNSLLNGSLDLYSCGFMQGYNTCKNKLKQNGKGIA